MLLRTMEKEPCIRSSPKRESEMTEAPDRGWAWVVACAACLINFIMAGLGRMSGVLFVAFIDIYRVDRRAASTPFSVRSATRNLLGPVVGILGQKYGVRLVTIVGGVVATLSSAACFYAKDIVWITILWGALSGAGSALTITLPQVTIGQYFKKYRTTAAGMAFSGGCVGSFLFPVMLEQLLHSYGMQGTFLLMAAIIMHTIPAAMILKKPPWLKARNTSKEAPADICNANLDVASPTTGDARIEGNEVADESTPDRNGLAKADYPDLQFLRRNSKLIAKLFTTQFVHCEDGSRRMDQEQAAPVMESCILAEMEDMYSSLQCYRGRPQFYRNLRLAKKTLFNGDTEKEISTGSLKSRDNSLVGEVYKSRSVPDISNIPNDVTKNYVLIKFKEILGADAKMLASCFPDETEYDLRMLLSELQKLHMATSHLQHDMNVPFSPSVEVAVEDPSVKVTTSEDSNSFADHIKTAVRLYGNPLFLLICFCRAVHFVTFVPVMTTVVDFVMDKGLQEHDGKWAIAALSLGDLLGRLCLGWITDYGFMTLPRYMLVVMLVQGASTAALPLMHTKVTLYTGLGVFGMLQGSLFIRHPVLVSKYMGNNEQSIAMGCINFFSGFLGFGLPYYIGYFRDVLGSYDYIFYINGAFGAFIGSIWLFEPYLYRKLSAGRISQQETV